MGYFKNIILIIIAGLFLITCKKYPEDKFISIRKPEKRIVGTWHIKTYSFNGNSIIDEINIKSFSQNIDIRDVGIQIINRPVKNIYGGEIEYSFIPSDYFGTNTYVSFLYYNELQPYKHKESYISLFNSNFTIRKGTNWNIKQLSYGKMHLQLQTDSGNYDIHFSKK